MIESERFGGQRARRRLAPDARSRKNSSRRPSPDTGYQWSEGHMRTITNLSNNIASCAVFVLLLTGLAGQVLGQSPLFPNTRPVYNNPYGVPSSNPNGPFYRGQALGLKPLPAAYSQPLPAPSPAVNSGFGGVPYYYGNHSNIRVFGSTATYPPAQNRNWAPNYSSR